MNNRTFPRLSNSPRTTLSTTGLVFCLTLVCWVVPGSKAQGQTSADELYLAVQQAQLEMGNGSDADKARSAFLIREIETESARGATADLSVLRHAAEHFASATEVPQSLEPVHKALQDHIRFLESAFEGDLDKTVSELPTELKSVELLALQNTRDETLKALQDLDAWHEEELSYYGRYLLNKQINFKQLVSVLEDFRFRIGDIDPDQTLQEEGESDEDFKQRIERLQAEPQNVFNREINSLRNLLARSRRSIGQKLIDYPSPAMVAAEAAVTKLEDQTRAYLLFQSRGRASFEEQLQVRKQAFISQDGKTVDPSDRLYQAELGRWLAFLKLRNQDQGLDAAARMQYSKPNLKVTIQESLANRVGGRAVAQTDPVDEVIVGSRAQGWSYTSGMVSVDFVDSRHSGWVRINLGGSVQSSTYTKEGPITAYTSSGGSFSATRDVEANVGSFSIYEPNAWAQISSQFLGTDCTPLVSRLAYRTFAERQWRAEEIASERARDRLLTQFTDETDVALSEGMGQLNDTRSRKDEAIEYFNSLRSDISELYAQNENGELESPAYDMIDPFVIPRVFVTSTDSELLIQGVLEGDNRLAAATEAPPATIHADVRVQIHESMVSNAVAPFLQGRLLENWKIRNTIESLASGNIELPEQDEEKPFSIRFEEGRPVQIEFDNNEIGVTVYGQQFRQGRNVYTDPLNIKVRFRIVRDGNDLKLVRSSDAKAEFTYDPLAGKNLDVAFRSFLQDNLDKATEKDPMEDATLLPANLVPLEYIEEEEIRARLENAVLVEASTGNGWLTLGWNYSEDKNAQHDTHLPAVWPVEQK